MRTRLRWLSILALGTTRLACAAAEPGAPAADLSPAEVAKLGWEAVPQILMHIQAPVFPDKNFPITDYGATAGATADCTEAIAKAIKGAKLVALDAAHISNVEQPKAFTEAALNFLLN